MLTWLPSPVTCCAYTTYALNLLLSRKHSFGLHVLFSSMIQQDTVKKICRVHEVNHRDTAKNNMRSVLWVMPFMQEGNTACG